MVSKQKRRNKAKHGGLPVGWDIPRSQKVEIGFMGEHPESQGSKKSIINYDGDSHLVTIGPTGAGKSRGSAIPALLSHRGPAIVVDVKGELYNTTSRYRREMGQKVYKIDPWGVVDSHTDAFNPLDILTLPDVDVEEEAIVLAKLIQCEDGFSRDRFWEYTSQALNAGIIAYLASSVPDETRRLSYAREMFATDFDYSLACLLDSNTIKSKLAKEEFCIYLAHPDRETRPSVRSSAQQNFRLLGTDSIRRAMDRSSFQPEDILNHKPISIYLVVPPHKLESHAPVLRVWLGAFLQLLCRRKSKGSTRTLFLVDEAAVLGNMDPLKQSITLLRGYGAQVWTFWQDVSQIRHNFPKDWQTIVNNAGVLQLLDPRNARMAEEYAHLVGGLSATEMLGMPRDQQILITEHQREPIRCGRIDYLSDSRFKGRYDKNPMFMGPKSKPKSRGRGKSASEPQKQDLVPI